MQSRKELKKGIKAGGLGMEDAHPCSTLSAFETEISVFKTHLVWERIKAPFTERAIIAQSS